MSLISHVYIEEIYGMAMVSCFSLFAIENGNKLEKFTLFFLLNATSNFCLHSNSNRSHRNSANQVTRGSNKSFAMDGQRYEKGHACCSSRCKPKQKYLLKYGWLYLYLCGFPANAIKPKPWLIFYTYTLLIVVRRKTIW